MANLFFQNLEDMDLIFGDTAAYEEKRRIKRIEADLRGAPIAEDELKEPLDTHRESV